MVGLVIISHSRALARALTLLVGEVTETDIPVAFSGGAGPDHEAFGTDALEIAEAIRSVDSGDGVLVLMDLGSAVLSAEMAIELLPEEMQDRVHLCAGPLVEGAIAAGVQLSLGTGVEAVCAEARAALNPKAEQLGDPIVPGTAAGRAKPDDGLSRQKIVVLLENEHGLHARPAAQFVRTAAGFDAEVRVRNLASGKGPVTARSLNALATLDAGKNDQLEILADGPQAASALDALQALVQSRFGEPVETSLEARSAAPMATPGGVSALPAIPVSDGIAIGPLHRLPASTPVIRGGTAENPEAEWGRLQEALAATRAAIEGRRAHVARNLDAYLGEIFAAHLLILEDPDILEHTRRSIFEDGIESAEAWKRALDEVAGSYRDLENPHLRARAVDVEDVRDQVLRALGGEPVDAPIVLPEPAILLAPELSPTQTARLDMSRILGLVTTGGGPTSHGAILARAMGIPAVAGVGEAAESIADGTRVGLDGTAGEFYGQPSEDELARLETRRQTWLEKQRELLERTHLPAVTRDGVPVEVVANVGSQQDAETAVRNGAEGVGLLRTEFLFLTRSTPPSEGEQITILKGILQTLGDRPVIVRTLDVGGDKALPYLDTAQEANPFLGVRAVRLTLQHRDLFITQLRSILRAGAGHNVKVMFPLISQVREYEEARALLETAHTALTEEELEHLWPIETGIMVETPASALRSEHFAREVDFFSVGTNDLTQYVMAAERGNPLLSDYADALDPAVLRLVQQVVDAAHARGKWVGVCGELAGDPFAIPLLVGLGVDELSVTPAGIPEAKAVVRRLSREAVADLATQALTFPDAAQVREASRTMLQSG